MTLDCITVIGLGLIGGSAALALKERGFCDKVIGVDHNLAHTKEALELGLVDEITTLEEGVRKANLILIAIPVDSARKLLPTILDLITEEQTVTDMGSTKGGICSVAAAHSMHHRFVGGHPIAGTENSGPSAAFASLFDGKAAVLCPHPDVNEQALETVEDLYGCLGMAYTAMTPDEHDKHLAYVSHLSHISSFTLGLTVLDLEQSEKTIFDLAGSGFASTVRLAKSSPEMWAPIFAQNRTHLLAALDAYMEHLTLFRKLIEEGNEEEARQQMARANDIRRILEKP